jgi:glycosyltransferase involved in cell wall biosynthesis
VSDFYPPLIGGATRFAQLLAHELVRCGYEVVVATAWQPGTAIEEHDELGVAVHRLHGLTMRLPGLSANPYRRIPPPFPDPELVWRFRRLLRREQPDIVHSFGWLSYSCAVALLGSDTPLILNAQDYGYVCALGTLFQHGRTICSGPAARKCLACATDHHGAAKGALAVLGVLGGRRLLRRKLRAVQSVSHYVRDVLREHLLNAQSERLTDGSSIIEAVIPDFRVETDARSDETILARLPREPFILFVGALREVKGIRVLLAAYERLVDPPPLVLIGTRAPDMPTVFPPGVTVEHEVPNATVMAAWDRALFGVAPSCWPEPLGIVVHEAMSRGRAVIGTRPGGHAEMIEPDVDGLLVDAGDAEGLAAAMRRLISDGALRARLEQAAKAHSELFTAEALMPQVDSLIGEVLLRSRKGT